MAGLLVLATIAELIANPPATYTSEMTPAARAVYEQHKDAAPTELLAALDGLAQTGDLSAVEFLGEIYAFGLFGQAVDSSRACDLFERAAPERADAAHNFATCLYSGRARPQDLPSARQWYARAAERGWTTSLCGLGNMLIKGQGGEPDRPAGLALCRLAAERGDRDAQTDLGGYLLLGEVVERDPVEARRWLEQAARARQANAAYLLAQIYWKGDGVEQDRAVARQWFEVAHEAGRPDAAYEVLQTILVKLIDKSGPRPVIDRAYLTEALAWARIAAARDPDPVVRSKAAELIVVFEQEQERGPAG